MTNKLTFSSGVSLTVCAADAADAPRMTGGTWRWWHVDASTADAVAALESGILRREYETVTGSADDGTPLTEILHEDLSTYTVPGAVVDHRDGTCTIWARRPNEAERARSERAVYAAGLAALGVDTKNAAQSVQDRLDGIRLLTGAADLIGEDDAIIGLPVNFCPEWTAGAAYKAGRLVAYGGVKYLILQNVTAAQHYPPNMPDGAMLSVYKPYQGKHGYDWLYGEYCEIGFTRLHAGVLYRAIQDPGANIFPPDQVPAVWEIVD